MRFTQNPLTRLNVKVSNRQRLVFAGFCLAVGLLVGGVTFLLINFGNNTQSFAALGSNMGFENGTTEWTAISGTWNSNSSASYVRTGTKSLTINSSTTERSIKNTNCTVTIPGSGTNYIVVTAWAKSTNSNGRLRLGLINTGTSTETDNATVTSLNNSSFTFISFVTTATNGATYIPVVLAKSSSGSPDVYVDDVHIYTTTSNSADVTSPAASSAVTASVSGTTISLSWTNGTDAETSIDGVTILRYTGLIATDQALNNQGTYHATTSTIGPTSVGSWTVVYQGSSITSINDNTGSNGTYTYLIYMRDVALNYTSLTSAARVVVMNGSSGTTATLSSSTSIDGMYIASGNTLTVTSTLTFRTNSVVDIYGTLVHQGSIVNGSGNTVTIRNGGTYKYDRNGNSGYPLMTATWATGSTCYITGIGQDTPSGLNQTFYNFTWDCPNQNQNSSFPSGFNVYGDAQFLETGPGNSTRIIYLNDVHIKGNLYCSSAAQIKTNATSRIYFDGTALQTIQVQSNCTFSGIDINNSSGVKLLSGINIDTLCNLTSGTFNLNGYDITFSNGCTVTRYWGAMTSGNLIPANGSAQYNLVYANGGTTGVELTTSTSYLYSLTMSTSSQDVTLNKTAYVNGSLRLNGGKIITTSSYEVYVKNSSASVVTMGNSNSYIYGYLRRNILNSGVLSYLFPVGTASNPELATLELNNLLGTTNILASFSTTISGSSPSTWVNGTNVNTILNSGIWTMTPNTTPTGGTFKATLQGKGYTNGVMNSNPFRYAVIRRDNSSSAWTSNGVHSNATQSVSGGVVTAVRSSMTSLNDFAIAYGNALLPITLSMFNATQQSGKVNIVWATSAELNNAYFSLERSTNGVDFEMINEQNGQGTSTTPHNYNYVDENPLNGTNYYRLKQVDFDGTFTYSPIRQVTFTSTLSSTNSADITVYPNPGTGFFNFSRISTSGVEDHASIKVFDIKGQLVFQKTFSENDLVKIDMTSQPPGIYMANIIDANNQTISKQLVIQR